MFENLSSALQKTFKHLRGYGTLSEKNVKDGLREVRLALLEADVNFKVARDFIKNVQEACLGEEVLVYLLSCPSKNHMKQHDHNSCNSCLVSFHLIHSMRLSLWPELLWDQPPTAS